MDIITLKKSHSTFGSKFIDIPLYKYLLLPVKEFFNFTTWQPKGSFTNPWTDIERVIYVLTINDNLH